MWFAGAAKSEKWFNSLVRKYPQAYEGFDRQKKARYLEGLAAIFLWAGDVKKSAAYLKQSSIQGMGTNRWPVSNAILYCAMRSGGYVKSDRYTDDAWPTSAGWGRVKRCLALKGKRGVPDWGTDSVAAEKSGALLAARLIALFRGNAQYRDQINLHTIAKELKAHVPDVIGRAWILWAIGNKYYNDKNKSKALLVMSTVSVFMSRYVNIEWNDERDRVDKIITELGRRDKKSIKTDSIPR